MIEAYEAQKVLAVFGIAIFLIGGIIAISSWSDCNTKPKAWMYAVMVIGITWTIPLISRLWIVAITG